MGFLKRHFCSLNKHKGWADVFVRNIHGDEINHRDGKRSEWKCTHCDGPIYKDYLWQKPKPFSHPKDKRPRRQYDDFGKDGRFCEKYSVSYDDVHDFDK